MQQATVIIPTYNEKGNISTTIEALAGVFKTIKNWHMSILVVDDNSPDGTATTVRQLL
jgi:dolichol-phosphate mannosyltransferase